MAALQNEYKLPPRPWKYSTFRGPNISVNYLRWCCNKVGIDITDSEKFPLNKKLEYQKALREYHKKLVAQEKIKADNDDGDSQMHNHDEPDTDQPASLRM